MAIGARSQSARTYLEKNLDTFPDASQDELVKHCMRALRDTLPNEVELTVKVRDPARKAFDSLVRSRIAPLPLSVKTRHSVSWMMLAWERT